MQHHSNKIPVSSGIICLYTDILINLPVYHILKSVFSNGDKMFRVVGKMFVE